MNKTKVENILSFLGKLKKDYQKLKRHSDLTDYGQGQLDLVKTIEKELN